VLRVTGTAAEDCVVSHFEIALYLTKEKKREEEKKREKKGSARFR